MKKIIAILVITMLTYSVFAQNGSNASPTVGTTAYRLAEAQPFFEFYKLHAEGSNLDSLSMKLGYNLSSMTDEERENAPTIDYHFDNWKVIPQSSIRSPEVLSESFVKPVKVNNGIYAGDTVMGVKLFYPNFPIRMLVDILPPFPAPTGESNRNEAGVRLSDVFAGIDAEGNPTGPVFGIVKNVGTVRSAYLEIYGLQQQEKIYLITEDSSGQEFQYPFGSLDFVGWRMLEWVNTEYIKDAADRRLETLPLYPLGSSERRFKGFRVERSAQDVHTHFVTYIRQISLTFDKAYDDTLDPDIDDEGNWHILRNSVSLREQRLREQAVHRLYLEELENRKQFDYEQRKDAAANGQ